MFRGGGENRSGRGAEAWRESGGRRQRAKRNLERKRGAAVHEEGDNEAECEIVRTLHEGQSAPAASYRRLSQQHTPQHKHNTTQTTTLIRASRRTSSKCMHRGRRDPGLPGWGSPSSRPAVPPRAVTVTVAATVTVTPTVLAPPHRHCSSSPRAPRRPPAPPAGFGARPWWAAAPSKRKKTATTMKLAGR